MINILNKMMNTGLLPVINIEEPSQLNAFNEVFTSFGLEVVEIKFKNKKILGWMCTAGGQPNGLMYGFSDVFTLEQCKSCVEAGASFIASNIRNDKIIGWCNSESVPVIPVCNSLSEVRTALQMNFKVVKVENKLIEDLPEIIKKEDIPCGSVTLMPYGKFDAHFISKYMDSNKMGVVSIESGTFENMDNIEKLKEIVEEILLSIFGFQFSHMGINTNSAKEADKIANIFKSMFGFSIRDINTSLFLNKEIEINKAKGIGDMGHIAVYTNSIDRACKYLGHKGYEVETNTKKMKNGKPFVIYLKEQINGFGIHLMQKGNI